MAVDARFETIEEIAASINKKMGEDTMILGSAARKDVPRLSTGILSFDLAFGGGWPVNQWSELIAPPTFGKTALAYKTIAHNQDLDPDFTCLFVSAETYVRKYAEAIGVDTDRLWVVESNELEPCFDLVLRAIAARAVDMVVLDSLSAFASIKELDMDMDEVAMGNAKLISNFFKKSRKAQRRSLVRDERNCTMLCLNSWRDAIGVKYGDPRVTPGGKAKDVEFFLRAEVTRDEWLTDGSNIEDRVGQVIKIRTIKNKLSPQQRIAQVDYYFDETKGGFHMGEFDAIKDIVNVSVTLGVIKRAGASYSFGDYKWRGKDCAKVIIPADVRSDLDLQRELIAACHYAYTNRDVVPELADEDDE